MIMKRVVHALAAFAALSVLITGVLFAQGQRALVERKAWYVDEDGKTFEVTYWRIVLGDYNLKVTRNFPGEGAVTVDAGMNFQFLSSGYIEGNGQSAKGRVSSLPGMRIRVDGGEPVEIKLDNIEYIYDYGSKVVTKDNRRGDFLIAAEGQNLEPKRFLLSEYRMQKGSFGEQELREVKDRAPIVALAFSKEAAAKAAKEPKTEY